MTVSMIVLLALDLAFFLSIFILLSRIQSRLDRIEKRLFSRGYGTRPKKPSTKKDS